MNPLKPLSAHVSPEWKRLILAGLTVSALVCAVAGCAPSQTQRIKITVSVDDNGVLRTGSSVMQFSCTGTDNSLGGMGIGSCAISGEAVPVDLGAHGYLFMLLCGGGNYLQDGVISDIMGARPSPYVKSWDLTPDRIPRLVTFDNPDDSRTVESVDPQHLDRTFGQGISLKSIHAEYTREPITRGQVELKLPWLGQDNGNSYIHESYRGSMYLSGGTISNGLTLSSHLQYYNFKTGK